MYEKANTDDFESTLDVRGSGPGGDLEKNPFQVRISSS